MTTNVLDAYKLMLKIRLYEDKLQEICLTGEGADWHFSKGEEALSVGVMTMLKPTDYLLSHHRSIAPLIAKGADLNKLTADLLGKAAGPTGGVGGEMDYHDDSIRFIQSFQLVGSVMSVACGVAFSIKYHYKTNDIVVAFLGDAALSAGPTLEALNISAIQRLPILWCVSDNKIAGNVRPEFYASPNTTIKNKFESFGIGCLETDGCMIDDVMTTAAIAINTIREEERPFAIVGDTVRLSYHKQGMGELRSREELAMLARRDPLTYAERKFGIYKDTKEIFSKDINNKIEAALEIARNTSFAHFNPNADL